MPAHDPPWVLLVSRIADFLPAHPPCACYNTVELRFLDGRDRLPGTVQLNKGGLLIPNKRTPLPPTGRAYLRAGVIFAASSTISLTPSSSPIMNRHHLNCRLSSRAFMSDYKAGGPNCPSVFRSSPIHCLTSSNCSKYTSRHLLRACMTGVLTTGISMHYHTVIIQMFGLLMRTVEENEGSDGCHPDLARARNISLSSALQVASLAQSHRAEWSVQHMCETTVQWLSVSLSTLLERLDDPVYATAFTELASIMRACARRWMMAKGALRMVQTTAKALGRALSEEIETQFAQFEANGWEANDRRHFSSLYPNFAVVLRPKGDLNAEEVLERCLEQLTLEDNGTPETNDTTSASE